MIVKLKKGVAVISDIITRKTQKEYKAKLFENVKIKSNMSSDDLELDLIQAENANDSLVVNMVKSLKIDDKDIIVTEDSLQELEDDDFNLILGECQKILNKNSEEKKT